MTLTPKFRNTIHMMGMMLTALGAGMIPPLVCALYFHEKYEAVSFFVTLLFCLLIGVIILRNCPPCPDHAKKRDGFFIVAFGWILAALVGTIPMMASGAIPSFIDAFFEACSGFTTTGATILSDVEAMPRSLLLWRSIMVWIGGAGIILFTAFLLPFSTMGGHTISRSETTNFNVTKTASHFSGTVRYLFKVYLILTVLLLVVLKLSGMTVYETLIHALSTVSTGGFSCYNDGIAHFAQSPIPWIIIIAMFLSGMNFNVYTLLRRRGLRAVWDNMEIKFYVLIILGGSLLIFIDLITVGNITNPGKALTDAVFQVTSSLSTTGLYVTYYEAWPTFAKMILFALMLMGACTSSLGGGPKLLRILVSLKMIRRDFSMKLHPHRVFVLTVNRMEISQTTATNIINFMFLYFFTIFAGSILLAFNGFDLMTTFSAAISCINNNGLGFGLIAPPGGFAEFSGFSKFVMSLLMLAGRLELYTIFMLFSPRYWDPNRV